MIWILHRLKTIMALARLKAWQTSAVVSLFPDGRTVVTGYENERTAIAAMRRDWDRGADDTWVWSRG